MKYEYCKILQGFGNLGGFRKRVGMAMLAFLQKPTSSI